MRTLTFLCALIGLIGFAGVADAEEIKLEQVSIYPGEFSPDPLIVRKGEPWLKPGTEVRVRPSSCMAASPAPNCGRPWSPS